MIIWTWKICVKGIHQSTPPYRFGKCVKKKNEKRTEKKKLGKGVFLILSFFSLCCFAVVWVVV